MMFFSLCLLLVIVVSILMKVAVSFKLMSFRLI